MWQLLQTSRSWEQQGVVLVLTFLLVILQAPAQQVMAQEQETFFPERGPGFYLQTIVDTYDTVVPDLGMTWPFITNPVFADVSYAVTEFIAACHLVTEEQRAAWEDFSVAFSDESGGGGGGIVSPTIYSVPEDTGLATAVPVGTGLYCPLWTHQGSHSTLVNLDLFSLPEVAQATGGGTVATTAMEGGIRIAYQESTALDNAFGPPSVPFAWLIYPITTEAPNSTNPQQPSTSTTVVGYVLGLIPDEVLNDIEYRYICENIISAVSSTQATWARTTNGVFPFVISPVFDLLAQKCIDYDGPSNTSAVPPGDRLPLTVDHIAFCPFVSPENVLAWEAYVAANAALWTVAGDDDDSESGVVTPFIFSLGPDGEQLSISNATNQPQELYCPVWQNTPAQAGLVNFDILSVVSNWAVQNHFAGTQDPLTVMTNSRFPLGPNRQISLYPVWNGDSGPLVGLTVAVAEERTRSPSLSPTGAPSDVPTMHPTEALSPEPILPTAHPTGEPSTTPPIFTASSEPTSLPTGSPTNQTGISERVAAVGSEANKATFVGASIWWLVLASLLPAIAVI